MGKMLLLVLPQPLLVAAPRRLHFVGLPGPAVPWRCSASGTAAESQEPALGSCTVHTWISP